MIPILYDSNEKYFTSNGLGRLRDCLSCTVTEERNGIYECEFQYPVNGAHFSEIEYLKIIGAKHEYSDDVQPFEIVGSTKPMNGVVTFHAVHISYRQSKMVAYGTNINTLGDAFDMLKSAESENPFYYSSDLISDEGYMAAANGEPRSVKSLLGGIDGSILDTYGGEYEWDKFNVILHQSRGRETNYIIRYGVNLLDYSEEIDYSETYTSVIPYWKGTGENNEPIFVIGHRIDYSDSISRAEVVPVDLTDRFEAQPEKEDVEYEAVRYLQEHQPTIPLQNIKVNFVRLEDTEEYLNLVDLFNCKLCDIVKVSFPMYNVTGNFKIVKTAYNVLQDKFDSVELGVLPTTLSQALGLSK